MTRVVCNLEDDGYNGGKSIGKGEAWGGEDRVLLLF